MLYAQVIKGVNEVKRLQVYDLVTLHNCNKNYIFLDFMVKNFGWYA